MNQSNKKNGTIAEATPSHLDAMIKIFQAGQYQHVEMVPDIFCDPDNPDEIGAYIQGYFKPRNPFHSRRKFAVGWFVDGELGGYLLYQLYSSSDIFFGQNRWVCFVSDIAISPDHQSKGGATQLMDYLVTEKAGPLKNCIISGQVWKGNDASSGLFRKFGFDVRSENFFKIIK